MGERDGRRRWRTVPKVGTESQGLDRGCVQGLPSRAASFAPPSPASRLRRGHPVLMAVIVASVAGASSFQWKGAVTAKGMTPERRAELRRISAGLKARTVASGALRAALKMKESSNRELRRRWEGLRYISLSEVVVEAEARLTELSEGAEPDPDQDTTRALVDGVTQELHRITTALASEHQHRNREARRRPASGSQEPPEARPPPRPHRRSPPSASPPHTLPCGTPPRPDPPRAGSRARGEDGRRLEAAPGSTPLLQTEPFSLIGLEQRGRRWPPRWVPASKQRRRHRPAPQEGSGGDTDADTPQSPGTSASRPTRARSDLGHRDSPSARTSPRHVVRVVPRR